MNDDLERRLSRAERKLDKALDTIPYHAKWLSYFRIGILVTSTLFAFSGGCASGVLLAKDKGKKQPKEEKKGEYHVQHSQDRSVYMHERVGNKLAFLYDGLWREIPVCLEGKTAGRSTWIDDVVLPIYVESTEDSARITAKECRESGRYIGIAHNHPGNSSCEMSADDRTGFIKDGMAKVHLVVCGADRKQGRIAYGIYLKEQNKTPMQENDFFPEHPKKGGEF